MRSLLFLCLAGALTLPPASAAKKNKEEVTQTLAVPRDPPAAVIAETRKLTFFTSPLQTHGLLSAQTREAVREIMKAANGMTVVKLRAFVAGTGDIRRVPQIVSETFSEKKRMPLPVVSVVQAGGLPLEGAQIILEATAEAKHEVNPQGLLYISGAEHSLKTPFQPLGPLANQSLDDLARKLAGIGQPLRVTCFVSSLDDALAIQSSMSHRFGGAAMDIVQSLRASPSSSVACEAVARSASAEVPADPGVAALRSDRVVLTGTQVAYGLSEKDGRLAFQRLDRVLGAYGASLKSAVSLHIYPLSPSIAAQAGRLRLEFVDAAHPPVTTVLPVESLPGMDATFALEATAPSGTP